MCKTPFPNNLHFDIYFKEVNQTFCVKKHSRTRSTNTIFVYVNCISKGLILHFIKNQEYKIVCHPNNYVNFA